MNYDKHLNILSQIQLILKQHRFELHISTRGSFRIVNTTVIDDLQLVQSVNVELQMPRKHRYGMTEYRRGCVHKRLTVSYMQNVDCVEGLGP